MIILKWCLPVQIRGWRGDCSILSFLHMGAKTSCAITFFGQLIPVVMSTFVLSSFDGDVAWSIQSCSVRFPCSNWSNKSRQDANPVYRIWNVRWQLKRKYETEWCYLMLDRWVYGFYMMPVIVFCYDVFPCVGVYVIKDHDRRRLRLHRSFRSVSVQVCIPIHWKYTNRTIHFRNSS